MTLEIDPTAKISPLADIEDSVRGTRIVVKANARIDSFVKIKPAGGVGDVIIGEGTYLNSGCVIYTGNGVTIGKGCAIAANTTFASTNHAYADRNKPITHQGFLPSKGGIVLGDDVWVGANCVFLDGAQVGDGCVIGAGSIVRRKLDAYGIYSGNPPRKLGERR